MKKSFINIAVLLLFIGFFAFTSCDKSVNSDESIAELDETDITTVENSSFLLNPDGTSPFTVVYEDKRYDRMASPSVKLKKSIEESLGTTLGIATDFLDGITLEDTSDLCEILIGRTNRPESEEVYNSLKDETYAICVVGSKLVIRGRTNEATIQAVDYFIENFAPTCGTITADFNYVGEYKPDPLDIVLADNSTGEVEPRIVESTYQSDDVVIADIIPTLDNYAVSGDGMGDSTNGIQKALNDCRKNGGGTVYLPAGRYVVTGSISIPAYVTLRGDWNDPDAGNNYGTVIEYRGKSEDSDTTGLFKLGGSGGVVGITVYYPEQSLDDVKTYPFTFYTDGQGDNYMLSTVKNCTVINGYRGIGACCTASGAHEQLTVENFKGTFLYTGAEVYNQADVGTWQNVYISNKYWCEANTEIGMLPADKEKLGDYTRENTIGLILGDLEWTEFISLHIDGCKIGVQITNGKRIQFAGSLYNIEITSCSLGLDVIELDTRWGMVIANSTIEGGINNATKGLIKLCGVEVSGEIKGEVKEYDDDISSIEVDLSKSYTKPSPNLYVVHAANDYSKDVSAEVQAVLDEAGKSGGVVYIPSGIYRFDAPITVPAGVELRGSSSVATRDQGGGYLGTLFYCYYGDDAPEDAENAQAFITLAGENAGINGIRIRYPENTPYDDDRTTTYAIRGTASGVYVVNCSLASADLGVDFSGCDNFFIKKVSTCCYTNTYLLGGNGGVLAGCLQNGTVIQRCGAPEQTETISGDDLFPVLFDSILRRYASYITIDGGENLTVYNTFCYGCAMFVNCKDGQNITCVNLGADNIGIKYAQITLESGSLSAVNIMRYNGKSLRHNGGHLEVYNRITINDKKEASYIEEK